MYDKTLEQNAFGFNPQFEFLRKILIIQIFCINYSDYLNTYMFQLVLALEPFAYQLVLHGL